MLLNLDKHEALDLVRERLEMTNASEGWSYTITDVEERSWGWVISWAEDSASSGPRADRGTYLIDRGTGRVGMGVAALGLEPSISGWRRGDLADLPPLV